MYHHPQTSQEGMTTVPETDSSRAWPVFATLPSGGGGGNSESPGQHPDSLLLVLPGSRCPALSPLYLDLCGAGKQQQL